MARGVQRESRQRVSADCRGALSLLALLVQKYKYCRQGDAGGSNVRLVEGVVLTAKYTLFACFTSTNVQILTQKPRFMTECMLSMLTYASAPR